MCAHRGPVREQSWSGACACALPGVGGAPQAGGLKPGPKERSEARAGPECGARPAQPVIVCSGICELQSPRQAARQEDRADPLSGVTASAGLPGLPLSGHSARGREGGARERGARR